MNVIQHIRLDYFGIRETHEVGVSPIHKPKKLGNLNERILDVFDRVHYLLCEDAALITEFKGN